MNLNQTACIFFIKMLVITGPLPNLRGGSNSATLGEASTVFRRVYTR